jgi:hypothetical protein
MLRGRVGAAAFSVEELSLLFGLCWSWFWCTSHRNGLAAFILANS